jgi:hypothetical protein
MNKLDSITYERVAITSLLVASAFGLAPQYLTVAAISLMLVDAFKHYVNNKKSKEASKQEIAEIRAKLELIDKTVSDKMSLMDNKVAGLGLSRRNA